MARLSRDLLDERTLVFNNGTMRGRKGNMSWEWWRLRVGQSMSKVGIGLKLPLSASEICPLWSNQRRQSSRGSAPASGSGSVMEARMATRFTTRSSWEICSGVHGPVSNTWMILGEGESTIGVQRSISMLYVLVRPRNVHTHSFPVITMSLN